MDNVISLNFSISVTPKEAVCNGRFQKIRIRAFATGSNAKTEPINLEVLELAKDTLYHIPIVWQYNRYYDDAGDHSASYGLGKKNLFLGTNVGVPAGFIPKEDNPITFEEDETGRIWLTCNALIWTRYSGDLLRIIARDDGIKNVSAELVILNKNKTNDKRPHVEDCVFQSICILGERITEAVADAFAELTFSEEDVKKLESDTKLYMSQYETFSNNQIVVDNSYDKAINTEWHNPRKKLYGQLMQQKNANDLIKEAYFSVNYDWREAPTKLQYGHHIVENNQLILHKQGLMKAFSELEPQQFVSDDIKNHLTKHFSELGLNETNFFEFGISQAQYDKYFSKKDGEETLTKPIDASATPATEDVNASVNPETGEKTGAENMSTEGETPACGAENMSTEGEKPEGEKPEGDKPEGEKPEGEKPEGEEDKENMSAEGEKPEGEKTEMSENTIDSANQIVNNIPSEELSGKLTQVTEQLSALQTELSTLQEEKAVFMSKLESMSDYDELKTFKIETENRARRAEEIQRMEAVFSEIESKFPITKDKKEELMSKITEFSSVDAWTNYVKAYTFDNIDKKDGIVRMGLPNARQENSTSLWGKYINKK